MVDGRWQMTDGTQFILNKMRDIKLFGSERWSVVRGRWSSFAMIYKVLLISVLLSSCSGTRMIETDLYFAQSKPNGEMITEKEWTDFREHQIARIFKEGSTVIKVSGNWFDPDRHVLITEPTCLVIYLYKRSKHVSEQIDSLRNLYKNMFQQQSVLRVDKKVKAEF